MKTVAGQVADLNFDTAEAETIEKVHRVSPVSPVRKEANTFVMSPKKLP